MTFSVICHVTCVTVVYMRSHCKCFQDRELMHFCYPEFGFTNEGKWNCAIGFGIRYLHDTSVGFKLKKTFQEVLYFH